VISYRHEQMITYLVARTAWPARLAIALLALLALAVTAVLVLRRDIVEYAASTALTREVTIAGPVQLSWDWPHVTLRLHEVRIDSTAWSATPLLAESQAVALTVNLRALLTDFRVAIPRVELSAPLLYLERRDDGTVNWKLGEAQSGDADVRDPSAAPLFTELRIHDGAVSYEDARSRVSASGTLSTVDLPDGTVQVTANADGTYQDQPLQAQVVASSVLEYLSGRVESMPVRFTLTSDETRLEGRSELVRPLLDSAVELHLRGPDPAQLYPLLPLAFLPSLPPYDVSATISYDGSVWHARKISGTTGNSDVKGDLSFRPGERYYIEGTLHSDKLDIDDLAGLAGHDPAPERSASGERRAPARAQRGSGRVFSDKPINIARAAASDLALTYRARRTIAATLPLQDVNARIELDRGTITFTRLAIGLGGGELRGSVRLVPAQDTLDLSLELAAEDVDLGAILRQLDRDVDAAGTIDGRAKAKASGRSIAALMATMTGSTAAYMAGGRFDVLLVELLGVDPGEAAVAWLVSDQTVPIRCAFVAFEAVQGRLQERTMVFDTTDTLVLGSGTIDLEHERLDLILVPRAKDLSLLSAQSNVHIRGTFQNPEVGPKPLEALASLLTPIDLGDATDADCQRLREQARQELK
jgi:hypothetical protein